MCDGRNFVNINVVIFILLKKFVYYRIEYRIVRLSNINVGLLCFIENFENSLYFSFWVSGVKFRCYIIIYSWSFMINGERWFVIFL